METYEEIQETLTEDGLTLTFDDFTMLGLLESSTFILKQEPSLSEVEQQEFNFYVSTADCVTNEVLTGLEFITADDTYEYTFNVLRNPIPFGDNWSRLPVSLLGREEV